MLISHQALKGQVQEKYKRRPERERDTKRQKGSWVFVDGQSQHEMDSLAVSLMHDSLLLTFIMLYLGKR